MTSKEIELLIRHIGHEVKNPLSTLKGYSELALLKKDDPQYTKKALDIISGQVTRIEDIFNSLNPYFVMKPQKYISVNMCEILKQAVFKVMPINGEVLHLFCEENGCIETDESIIKTIIELVTVNFLWESYPNAQCNIISRHNNEKKIYIEWQFIGVDLSPIQENRFFFPYSNKGFYKSGIDLFAAFYLAELIGLKFIIAEKKNSFILTG